MSYTSGNPGNITRAAEIVVSAFEYISQEPLEITYGNIYYPDFFPQESFDGGVSEGDDIYSKRIEDYRGTGAFRAVGSNEVPMVGITQDKISTPLFNASIGSVIDLQDIARADEARQKGLGRSAVEYSTRAMAIASDRHVERTLFFGDTVVNGAGTPFYPGLLNNQFVPATTVATGGSGFTQWINGANSKTPDEVIYDLAVAINTVYENTLQTALVTEIYLPSAQMAYITNLKAGTRANDEVVWRFVSEQNITTAESGQTIVFRGLPYLKGAGAGGTDRMMVVQKVAKNYMIGMPIPYRNRTSDTFGFLEYLWGEYKFSPVVLPYPETMGYWDGI